MQFKKIQDKTVENILKNYEPSEEILAITNNSMTPDVFLKTAIDNKLFLDAVIFLAHALPLRESIYWGLMTIEHLKDKFTPKEQHVIKAVKEWFNSPDESTRRYNGELAEQLELKNGPAWLSEAVFWSGGSILPPESPVTEPPQYLYAKAVIGAISLGISLNEKDEEITLANYIHCLKIGFNIAQGGNGKIL